MSKRKQRAQTQAPKSSAPMPYFSISRHTEEQSADIYIFGDIAHNKGGLAGLFQANSDQSSYDLANQVAGIPEDWAITVHINSNGGELKEGLGIYNVLKSRNVTTVCEGFAASAGSVIFCAGKERIMQPASLLFIHQAQMSAEGNSDDFQKAADDLRIVTSAAVEAYKEAGIMVEDDKLDAMMKAETWITPEEAVAYGFATRISEPEENEGGVIVNDAMHSIMAAVKRTPAGEILTTPVNQAGSGWTAVPAETMETLERFSETVGKYEEFFSLASKALETINKDPEVLGRIKKAAYFVVGGSQAQESGKVNETKGFFGFKK